MLLVHINKYIYTYILLTQFLICFLGTYIPIKLASLQRCRLKRSSNLWRIQYNSFWLHWTVKPTWSYERDYLGLFCFCKQTFSFDQIEIIHLWLDFYVFSSVGKALAISAICFGDAHVFSGWGFIHIPKWKTLCSSLLRNPWKIPPLFPSLSSGEQLWVTQSQLLLFSVSARRQLLERKLFVVRLIFLF